MKTPNPTLPTTVAISAAFGPYARLLSGSLINYTDVDRFSGPACILVPRFGRAALNQTLAKDCAGQVVIIDSRHYARVAVFGASEAANAVKGRCRAVLVFGSICNVATIAKSTIPILATDHTPRVLASDNGEVEVGFLDSEAGLITSEYYVVGDADGVVAVLADTMQERFSVS